MKNSFMALGTKITLECFNNQSYKLFEKSKELIKYYEKLFSMYISDSELNKINKAAGKYPVKVHNSTLDLIKLAKKFSDNDSNFDITIGPLVKEWKIGLKHSNKIPNKKKINKLLKLVDSHNILINDKKKQIYLKKNDMIIDLGGIAKGYIADKIKDLWNKYKVTSGIINLGGNIVLIGPSKHNNNLWNVGIRNPWGHRNDPLMVVKTPPCSIVTSGIYERYFYDQKGHFYHHIIDPKTGYPFKTNLTSVTVFTNKSVIGEIESSKLFFHKNQFYDPNLIGAVFIFNNHLIKMVGFNKHELIKKN